MFTIVTKFILSKSLIVYFNLATQIIYLDNIFFKIHILTLFTNSIFLLSALTLLYTGVVSNILNPEIYPAALVGYSTSITPNSHGLQLTLSGFTDTEVMMKVIDLLVNGKNKMDG